MRRVDRTGQRFGRLVAQAYAPVNGRSGWRCDCDCGGAVDVRTTHLVSGAISSCGCLAAEVRRSAPLRHGHSRKHNWTPEYRAWMGMKDRCYRVGTRSYADYGGRGITVCDRWRASFEAFLNDMGPRPSREHSLDRIDVNGHYDPNNCRWADRKTQARNVRGKKLHSLGNEHLTLAELADRSGNNKGCIHFRLRLGWTAEDAIAIPSGTPQPINRGRYSTKRKETMP